MYLSSPREHQWSEPWEGIPLAFSHSIEQGQTQLPNWKESVIKGKKPSSCSHLLLPCASGNTVHFQDLSSLSLPSLCRAGLSKGRGPFQQFPTTSEALTKEALPSQTLIVCLYFRSVKMAGLHPLWGNTISGHFLEVLAVCSWESSYRYLPALQTQGRQWSEGSQVQLLVWNTERVRFACSRSSDPANHAKKSCWATGAKVRGFFLAQTMGC